MSALITLLKVLGVIGIALVLVCLYFLWTVRRLFDLRRLQWDLWRAVDDQIALRHEIISEIAATACHSGIINRRLERRIYTLIEESRGVRTSVLAHIETELTRLARRVFAASEARPHATGGAAFEDLKRRLAGVDNSILSAAAPYNRAVRHFNIKIHLPPSGLVAWVFSVRVADLFEIETLTDVNASSGLAGMRSRSNERWQKSARIRGRY